MDESHFRQEFEKRFEEMIDRIESNEEHKGTAKALAAWIKHNAKTLFNGMYLWGVSDGMFLIAMEQMEVKSTVN